MPTSDPHGPNPPVDPRDPAADDEYELEDPDDSITDYARQQAAEDLVRANEALEIDNAQRAMEERITLDDDLTFKFRFQVKHLLLLTTVVSLVFAISNFLNADGVAVLMVLTMIALFGANAYLQWQERKRFEKASERRAEAVRRIRERQAAQQRGEPLTIYDEEIEEEAEGSVANAVEEERFRISFSVRDMLIATTVAAVVMGLGVFLGQEGLAVVLGLIAVSGLGAYGLGVPLPGTVVTVWWVTLLLYIVLSLARAVGLIGGAA